MASNSAAPDQSPAAPARPFQFTLWQFMVGVSWLCVAAAAFYWVGLFAVLVIGLVTSGGLLAIGGFKRITEAVTIAFVSFALTALLLPAIRYSPPSGRGNQCRTNLKMIGLALQNYHDVYGTFPPAYVADASGKPIHSWRVLILPFLEQRRLYDAYDFSEPWDGPNNSQLHSELMKAFSCPAGSKPGETNYVAVLGPQTMWPGERAASFTDLMTDGTSHTIMVVEVAGSGIHWMEPRDLHVVQMPMAINPARGMGISSAHPDGAQVVFADGHTEFLTSGLPPESLRAMLTIAGGEPPADR